MLGKATIWCVATAAAAAAFSFGAHAQVQGALGQETLELAQTLTRGPFIEQLPTGQIRFATTETTGQFLNALIAADVEGIFARDQIGSYQAGDADYIVIVAPTWDDARDQWMALGANGIADDLPSGDFVDPQLYARTNHLTFTRPNSPDRIVQVTTMLRTSTGVILTPECIAHHIVDYVYRGFATSGFDPVVCSRSQQ